MTATQALDYTGPENRGECGFCRKEENGYAKRNEKGDWTAACWACVKPENAGQAQPKREPVGSTFTDTNDADTDKPAKKSRGITPSSYRPKTA
jgi:hypothetical protein